MTVSGDSRPRLVRWARLRRDPMTGGMLLLYPEKGLALSASGAAILALCGENRTVNEIAAELATSYAAPIEEVTGDVLAFLRMLEARGLLAEGAPS